MKGYLLDTNVLIALLWPSHAHHTLAARQQTCQPGSNTALPFQLALAFGDDHFQA